MSVVKTRLNKPYLQEQYIPRRNILKYLTQISDNSIILVIAPAGYGKSVTISQWLDETGSVYGWISLDRDCDDVKVFIDYLTASIQRVYPNALSRLQELGNSLELPSVGVISELFINGISELEGDLVLVLDDYHLIKNHQVHEITNNILKWHSKNLKLVLLSRKELPLAINSLRAYEKAIEIRMSELGFDTNEIVELTGKILKKPISHDLATELADFTEGWIIGLKMALLSMKHGVETGISLSKPRLRELTSTQFFIDEIIATQSPKLKACFYKASLVSHFCEDLLHAICSGEGDLANPTDTFSFQDIINETLFVIPLDSDNVWYRFHHLFNEALQQSLKKNYSPDQIADMHRKASRWFEQNRNFDEAIKHALAAGDLEHVSHIMKIQLRDLLDNEKLYSLQRWMNKMPSEAMGNYLMLNLVQAFLYDLKQDHLLMDKALDKANSILMTLPKDLEENKLEWALYYCLKSILDYKEGRIQECVLNATHSIELLDSENSLLRDLTLLYRTLALIATGRGLEAEKKVWDCRASIQAHDQKGFARNSIIIAHIAFIEGDLDRIHNILIPVKEYYKGKSFNLTKGMVYYYLGYVYYERGQLDQAIKVIDEIWEFRYSSMPRWILHLLYLKMRALNAKGEKEEINKTIDEAQKYIRQLDLSFLEQLLACMVVEIGITTMDYEKIKKFHYKADYNKLVPYVFYYVPQLTSVKVKLQLGGAENLSRAQTELMEIIDYLRTTNNKNLLIQALTLQAYLHKYKGNLPEALIQLSLAVELARPGGYIRVFLDMGAEIREMMEHLIKRNSNDPYLHKILEAFSNEFIAGIPNSKSGRLLSADTSNFGKESLTAQEIKILQLAALGLRNKEIAEKLFLSPNSIKKYLYYIYQKLGVNNRAQAIKRARKMDQI